MFTCVTTVDTLSYSIPGAHRSTNALYCSPALSPGLRRSYTASFSGQIDCLSLPSVSGVPTGSPNLFRRGGERHGTDNHHWRRPGNLNFAGIVEAHYSSSTLSFRTRKAVIGSFRR